MGIGLREKNFIYIGGNYGFNQHHIQGKFASYLRNRACGLTALLNVLSYQEKKFTISKEEEERILQNALQVLRPKPWGILTFWEMNRALNRLNPAYRIVPYRGRFEREEVLAYLRMTFKRNKPVLLMNSNHPNKLLFHHWITLTGIEDFGEDEFIIFSSWGKKYRMKYEDLFPKGWIFRQMGTLERR